MLNAQARIYRPKTSKTLGRFENHLGFSPFPLVLAFISTFFVIFHFFNPSPHPYFNLFKFLFFDNKDLFVLRQMVCVHHLAFSLGSLEWLFVWSSTLVCSVLSPRQRSGVVLPPALVRLTVFNWGMVATANLGNVFSVFCPAILACIYNLLCFVFILVINKVFICGLVVHQWFVGILSCSFHIVSNYANYLGCQCVQGMVYFFTVLSL